MSTFGIGLIYEVEGASKTSVSFLLHIKKTWTWRTLRKYCPKWQCGCGWHSKLLKRCPAHDFLERHIGSLQGIWSCLVGDFISQKQTCPLLIGRSFYGNGNLMMLTRSLVKNHIIKCSVPKREQVTSLRESFFFLGPRGPLVEPSMSRPVHPRQFFLSS